MELRRGVVKGFDAATYTATVQLAGSIAVWLEGVPVARNIASTEVVTGRLCAVFLFDEGNPSDAIVLAVYTG